MLFYAICLFLFAALEIVTGIMTCCQNYEVIYDYYISQVNDLKAYSKAQGIATICMAIPSAACGVLFLVQPIVPFALIGIGVALVDIVGGFFIFNAIQNKYNGGMF